jgi:Predicted NTP pyrophosphohydrolase
MVPGARYYVPGSGDRAGVEQTRRVTAKRSAGILLFRRVGGDAEVLLGHMGGPFWTRRDAGAWSLPKGEYDEAEDPELAARREFLEELGVPPPAGDLVELGEVKQSGGKVVTAWALQGEIDLSTVAPGTSRWSGRRAPAGFGSSPRSTGWRGSLSTRPGRRSSPASEPSWTG